MKESASVDVDVDAVAVAVFIVPWAFLVDTIKTWLPKYWIKHA